MNKNVFVHVFSNIRILCALLKGEEIVPFMKLLLISLHHVYKLSFIYRENKNK